MGPKDLVSHKETALVLIIQVISCGHLTHWYMSIVIAYIMLQVISTSINKLYNKGQ